jgi:hypothetical protein
MNSKAKVKLYLRLIKALCQEGVWGSGGIALQFSISSRSGRFSGGEGHYLYPMDRRLGRPRRLSEKSCSLG